MSDDDQRLAELLRSAAASAERGTPAFDPDRIVAAAQRRRPWLAIGAALRSGASRLPARPALAFGAVAAALVVVVALAASGVFSGQPRQLAITSTTVPFPVTTTTAPPPVTSTTGPPETTTTLPTTTTVTTVPPTSTTVPPTSTTSTTTIHRYTYRAMWDGRVVTLTYEGDQDVGRRYADARPQRTTATNFTTSNPAFAGLVGKSLEVWSAPKEFPGELVVDDGEQGYAEKGTWVFTP